MMLPMYTLAAKLRLHPYTSQYNVGTILQGVSILQTLVFSIVETHFLVTMYVERILYYHLLIAVVLVAASALVTLRRAVVACVALALLQAVEHSRRTPLSALSIMLATRVTRRHRLGRLRVALDKLVAIVLSTRLTLMAFRGAVQASVLLTLLDTREHTGGTPPNTVTIVPIATVTRDSGNGHRLTRELGFALLHGLSG